MTSVAVIGGGIAGLVAAYRLRHSLGDAATITVIEASDRVGGKLRTESLAGGSVDVGAEAFIARRPEVPALLTELGLADQLVHPAGLRPLVFAGGSLHALPAATLMGVPSGPDSMVGLVDDATIARITDEPNSALTWNRDTDVDVASLVAARFGEQVVARSVDPLLGGVYSGRADTIGIRAALPTLAKALDAGAPNLTQAVRDAMPQPSAGPVFGGIRDGYGVLLDALVAAADASVLTGTAVESLERVGDRWSVAPIGTFDAVVLAVPAPGLASLLGDSAPDAAGAASRIAVAASALVTLAFPADTALPQHSGVLIGSGEPLHAKAFTLSSNKWPHLREREAVLVRASFGRFGDDSTVRWPDAELVSAARADLSTVLGVTAEPVGSVVQRWWTGLPQYGPGHLDRVRAIEDGVARLDGLEVAGGFLHGVGVPACVASGTAAAQRLAARVAP
ncbi:protoporphyrinogen oxidase [Antrihabitans cavernicola]|uniref:Coproporphyrinogen III oxidase n=1 Tax=Antrihabitans cavernicola TaxID=2495913 RepID=A0A5A7SCY9_9NOCA|nr:protoporphyrinogen oxidase [Spelaeibacter cavernicola]KAA0023424.1 protoporphyrinogen oxidase [Spelaeibacter cavernicola]